MRRITKADLDSIVSILNTRAGITGPITWSTPNAFQLDGAYGGYALVRVENESGGVREILSRGTRGEIYRRISDMLTGMEVKSNG
jgi:hypothetical protein